MASRRRRTFYAHPQALVESRDIGEGTRIWAFAHVMRGAVIGRDCNVCDQVFVESGATIGDRVTIKNGVAVWDHVTIEDDVFIGPGATLANDRHPRSRAPWQPAPIHIQLGATIGANATLIGPVTIGAWAFVGAGAVVTRNAPAHALVVGNPARQRGWVCACAAPVRFRGQSARCAVCGTRLRRGAGRVALVGRAARRAHTVPC